MRDITLSPSLICMDSRHLDGQVKTLLAAGVPYIHVDLIDGKFSPQIPLTLEELRTLRSRVDFPMDVHIMAMDNERYIREVLQYAPKQICFHWESTIHVDRLLRLIHGNGIACGVALAPATPVSVLEYAVELCDFVLLMLINPGYASAAGEEIVPYAMRKIEDCRNFLATHGRDIPIEVDGRVSLEQTPALIARGADILVSGSTGVFAGENSLRTNLALAEVAILRGIRMREERECIRNITN